MRGKGGGEGREERGRGREGREGRQSEETRKEGRGRAKEGGRWRGEKREEREGKERREEGRKEVERETHMLTMKGCRIEARMDFSLLTCSTCLSRITSEMVMILRAKNCLVGMSRASTTRPNVPVPECGGVWRVCGVKGVWG